MGDIGYLDEDGYLYLTDRRHHMIISGGVNIYPQEAENMLVTHPKVMDAAVFGIPDDEMGQSVKGVVQTVDPADATDEFGEELLTWLRDRLSHYKCPRSISFEAAVAAHRHRQAVQAEPDRQVLAGRYVPALRVVDLSDPPTGPECTAPPGRWSSPSATRTRRSAEYWLQQATFTLAEASSEDRRHGDGAVGRRRRWTELAERCERWPHAAAVCDDVLRAVDVDAPALAGVITESLAYSTLQSGPEFARWLTERGPAAPSPRSPIRSSRTATATPCTSAFNRPQRHNAFTTDARAALLEALTVALLDPGHRRGGASAATAHHFAAVAISAEFGTFADPASAHLARTRHSPALALDELTARLGRRAAPRCTVRCSAADWRWRRSAARWCAGPTRCSACRS